MRRGAHLPDERLVEVCVDRAATPAEDAHFAVCETCAGRRSRLAALLDGVADAAVAEADALFSDERLAAQRGRILQRIEQLGRRGRVIAFPAADASEGRPLRARPAARWIAGAAAAGLAMGLLLGHLAHDVPSFGRPPRAGAIDVAAARPAGQPPLRAAGAPFNDEDFLGEIETAVEGPRLIALRPLNDLTPR